MKKRGDKSISKRLRSQDADSFYEQYLARHPKDVAMRTRYARSLASNGRLQEAKAQYESAARNSDPAALVGLRQLALQQQASASVNLARPAIAPTARPAGKNAKGCLRLRNADIESLYPYVSLGTPFEVRAGAPGKATFPGGLPSLGKAPGAGGEETPGVVYTWKD